MKKFQFQLTAPALMALALSLSACGQDSGSAAGPRPAGSNASKSADAVVFESKSDSVSASKKDDTDGNSGSGKKELEEQEKAVDPVPAGDEPTADSEPTGEESAEQLPPPPPEPPKLALGLRNYDQINQTMSALTGVPTSTPAVATAFNTALTTSMPTDSDPHGFLGSQQVAIFKLSVEYCDALVADQALRTAFFGNFNFAGAPAVSLNDAGKAALADTLVTKLVGKDLSTIPPHADSVAMVTTLINDLLAGKDANNAALTPVVATAACASTLSGAATSFY